MSFFNHVLKSMLICWFDLFCSPDQNIQKPSKVLQMFNMLTFHLQLRMDLIHILAAFFSTIYKFGTFKTRAYRCSPICPSWTKLHTELFCLKQMFLKNGYPEHFINRCFKRFMDSMRSKKDYKQLKRSLQYPYKKLKESLKKHL